MTAAIVVVVLASPRSSRVGSGDPCSSSLSFSSLVTLCTMHLDTARRCGVRELWRIGELGSFQLQQSIARHCSTAVIALQRRSILISTAFALPMSLLFRRTRKSCSSRHEVNEIGH